MPSAPVYRHLDAKNRLLGLSLGQAFGMGVALFFALSLGTVLHALVVGVAMYVVLRFGLRKKPDGFVRHWLQAKARAVLHRCSLSARARARTPSFPFAPYLTRDVSRRSSP
jgi:hypothetical protein